MQAIRTEGGDALCTGWGVALPVFDRMPDGAHRGVSVFRERRIDVLHRRGIDMDAIGLFRRLIRFGRGADYLHAIASFPQAFSEPACEYLRPAENRRCSRRWVYGRRQKDFHFISLVPPLPITRRLSFRPPAPLGS